MLSCATTQSRLETFLKSLTNSPPANAIDCLHAWGCWDRIMAQAGEDFSLLWPLVAEDVECYERSNVQSINALKDYITIALALCSPVGERIRVLSRI